MRAHSVVRLSHVMDDVDDDDNDDGNNRGYRMLVQNVCGARKMEISQSKHAALACARALSALHVINMSNSKENIIAL